LRKRLDKDVKAGERAAQLIREYFKNPKWIERINKQKDNDDR
tara:strand:- start:896 stop:1021 length:126 start_codon:yes stop_codon:yes gene_type:complete